MTSVNDFLAESDYAPGTIEAYRWHLVRFDAWLQEQGIPLADLDGSTFAVWRDGHARALATRRLCQNAVRSYVRWACGGAHPILRVKARRPQYGPLRTLSAEEIHQLLAYLETEDPGEPKNAKRTRDWALISLLLDTGLRASECCRLQVQYVNLKERRLAVQIKGGEWGEGIFSVETRMRLRWWLAHRRRLAASGVMTLFVGVGGETRGQKMTPGGLRAVFRRLARDAGLQHFSPHSFRRSMATQMIAHGASTRMTALAGRWKSNQMIDVYTRALDLSTIDPFLPMSTLGDKEIHEALAQTP
jgi:integrase/recombinase XerD